MRTGEEGAAVHAWVRVPGPLDSLLLFLEGEEEEERKEEPEEKVEVLFQARRAGVICPTAGLSLPGSPGSLGGDEFSSPPERFIGGLALCGGLACTS